MISKPVNEEDRVVYLLASLPESYNVLITALEASAEVLAMAVVIEHLLHEEAKTKGQTTASNQEGALVTKFSKRPIIITLFLS